MFWKQIVKRNLQPCSEKAGLGIIGKLVLKGHKIVLFFFWGGGGDRTKLTVEDILQFLRHGSLDFFRSIRFELLMDGWQKRKHLVNVEAVSMGGNILQQSDLSKQLFKRFYDFHCWKEAQTCMNTAKEPTDTRQAIQSSTLQKQVIRHIFNHSIARDEC